MDAELDAHLSGWFEEGTTVRVQPKDLKVQVLDYVAKGEGYVALFVTRGGESPDMVLDAMLRDGELRRRGEEKSAIEAVELAVKVKAEDVTIGDDIAVAAIDLSIPTARVRGMAVYNQHFPEKMLLRLTGGEAELTADIHLEQETAAGYVKLRTDGLQSRLDDLQLSGELSLDMNLEGGLPSNMEFDISGSSLRLDEFKVVGDEKSFDQPGWTAVFDLERARVVWKKPIRLDMEGEAKLEAGAGEITTPYAIAGSEKIDVGAKGLMNAESREGIFLARYRKLTGILKVKDGERNFDIIGARKNSRPMLQGARTFSKDNKKRLNLIRDNSSGVAIHLQQPHTLSLRAGTRTWHEMASDRSRFRVHSRFFRLGS